MNGAAVALESLGSFDRLASAGGANHPPTFTDHGHFRGHRGGVITMHRALTRFALEPRDLATGALLVLLPDETFRISCTQAGPNNRFTQFLSMEVTPAIFEREIAPARTFVYYEEVQSLMDKNLIKGGSLENAIVVRGEAVLSKEPLRFTDEFVRHKILDIIGDLALVGHRIHALPVGLSGRLGRVQGGR